MDGQQCLMGIHSPPTLGSKLYDAKMKILSTKEDQIFMN